MGSDLSDSGSVYPVKALLPPPLRCGLRPLPLKVVHAESGAFGQVRRMNLLLGRSQLDRRPGLPLVRQVVCLQKLQRDNQPENARQSR